MPLDRATVRQRLIAARMLRGEVPTEVVGERLKQMGLGVSDPTYIETAGLPRPMKRREQQLLPLRDKHVTALAKALDVPEAWFTEPDTDKLICREPPPTPVDLASQRVVRQLDEVRADHVSLLGQLRELTEQVQALRQQIAETIGRG